LYIVPSKINDHALPSESWMCWLAFLVAKTCRAG
jgi:hypothetical protein